MAELEADKTVIGEVASGQTSPYPRAATKYRKQRPHYSCQECRRLKMKCDRRVPCSNCLRRKKPGQCNRASNPSSVSGSVPAPTNKGPQPDHLLKPAKINSDQLHGSNGQQQQLSQMHLNPLEPQIDEFALSTSQSLQDSLEEARGSYRLPNLVHLVHNIEPHVKTIDSSLTGGGTSVETSSEQLTPSGSMSQSRNTNSQFSDRAASFGTLVCSDGGRSRYLGPTASSEWLKDSETREMLITPTTTRAPSPDVASCSQNRNGDNRVAPFVFPFNAPQARIRTRDLLSRLPLRSEAWALAEAYYRYCAWHHDVAPRDSFKSTFDRVYKLVDGEKTQPPVNPQEIALVYMIMAQGTLYNIEMPFNDPSAEEWLYLSKQALVKGDYLVANTVHGLQTLHLMAHHYLESDKGRQGDNAWPLWGLVMRLIQAMGMHRDGTRWNLPAHTVEERRKIFWECNAADIFQAHCFSRPCAINPEHCDTAFPTEVFREEQSYTRLRFKLSLLSSEILNMAMKVRRPPYSAISDLNISLCEFERSIPFFLRCRAALLSMPSQYPSREQAIQASPEPSRTSMTTSFQQMNLMVNVSETIINLHRPYYAKALYDNDLDDPLKSEYAQSFLTVIERCSIIIGVVTDIHARFPAVSIRQWNLWYHVFNSALCLGTLILRHPHNSLASLIFAQLDASVYLFTSLIQQGANTPRYHRNLQGLLQLHNLASSKMSSTPNEGSHRYDTHYNHQEGIGQGDNSCEDIELIGWRTRLVERVGQDGHTIKTITGSTLSADASGVTSSLPANLGHLSDEESPSKYSDATFPSGTFEPVITGDLHDFWDPLLPDDLFRNAFEGSAVRLSLRRIGWLAETHAGP